MLSGVYGASLAPWTCTIHTRCMVVMVLEMGGLETGGDTAITALRGVISRHMCSPLGLREVFLKGRAVLLLVESNLKCVFCSFKRVPTLSSLLKRLIS